jgi:hypothetical protein
MSGTAAVLERLALAVLNGEGDREQILADMRDHRARLNRERDAENLRAFRSGDGPWVWPSAAPWAGF